MLKLVYFDGTELELHWNISFKRAITTARKNSNVYQIVRNNHTNQLLWERPAPEE